MTTALFADEFTTDAAKLPDTVRSYVEKSFPTAKIIGIKIDREMAVIEDYKVILSDYTKIEFRPSGELKELENKTVGIPANLLPSVIADYITKNCHSTKPIKFEIKPYGFEVELANGLELKFSRDGKLLEIDT